MMYNCIVKIYFQGKYMKSSFFTNAANNFNLTDKRRKELKVQLENFENTLRKKAESQSMKNQFLSRSYDI